jgi:predicted nuclease of predicted toxin-antitoxin system
MSRTRFLADQDLNDVIVRGIARLEPTVEFARLREFGLEELPDIDVLRFAARERSIVVSHDVNSMTATAFAMVAAGEAMHGLLIVHQDRPTAPVIESLLLILSETEAEDWIGRMAYLPF